MRSSLLFVFIIAFAFPLVAAQDVLPLSEIMTDDDLEKTGLANATPGQQQAFEAWIGRWTRRVLDQSGSYRRGEDLATWVNAWPSYASPIKTEVTKEDVAARQQANQRVDKVRNDGEIVELKDGSRWVVAPTYRYLTTTWQRDQAVEISPSRDIHYKYRLHNVVLDQVAHANMQAPSSPTGEKQVENPAKYRGNVLLKSVSLTGDTVILADDTKWDIAPTDIFRVRNWRENDRILVKPSNDVLYKFRLTNLDSGEVALANPKS